MGKVRLFCAAFIGAVVIGASAHAMNLEKFSRQMLNVQIMESQLTAMDGDVIRWKVGEWQTYQVKLGFFGQGTMKKSVTSEEGDGVWITQDISIMGQEMKSEILLDRKTGKILKMIVNGKEEKLPDEGDEPEIEVLDSGERDVTVPKGTFKALYIKLKMTDKNQGETTMELWVAPGQVNMEGLVKMVQEQQFGEVVLELEDFGFSN